MNVDEAIWFAGVLQRSGRKDSEAEAAPILAAEVERLRAELDAAKAASVVPVDVKSVYVNKASECVVAFIGDENKTVEFGGWLRDRIKERGEG